MGFTSIKAEIENVSVLVSSNRVVITPQEINEDTLKKIDQLLIKFYEYLPHTPITAIGHNFRYELEDGERFVLNTEFGAGMFKELYSDIGSDIYKESVLKHALKFKDNEFLVLNLSYILLDEKQSLDFNFHYQADQKPEVIKFALTKYYDSYMKSQSISEKLIIEEI